jgi:hypothetical protein
MTTMWHASQRDAYCSTAQSGREPYWPGGIVGSLRWPERPLYRFILHTVGGMVRSGGKASTVRKP